VRRLPIGEADILVTLVTRERGLVTASARAARRPTSKLGALEPMHTLRVVLEASTGEEIAKLREARIERARLGLLENEARLEAASRVLGYARSTVGQGVTEASGFDVLDGALEDITMASAGDARGIAIRAGARLLEVGGYALDLEACVRCTTPCPPSSAALLDPGAGGLVCRACGGGPILLAAGQRQRIAAWFAGEAVDISPGDEAVAERIVEQAIAAHGHDRPAPSRS
jgi:DNA repair protein RecO (recombination protein O)